MAKYRTEFKLKVVTEYLKGEMGYAALAKEYNIPSDTCLRRWVAAYRTNGTAGIARSRQQEKYSFQFKLHAVELYLSTETSYQDLAVSLGIKTPSLLAAWVQRYRAIGVDGLKPQRKGRRPQVSKEPSAKKVPADKQEEYLKQLEEENLKLRIEVAYLKESRRLRLAEEAQKRKQGSFAASEEHSS